MRVLTYSFQTFAVILLTFVSLVAAASESNVYAQNKELSDTEISGLSGDDLDLAEDCRDIPDWGSDDCDSLVDRVKKPDVGGITPAGVCIIEKNATKWLDNMPLLKTTKKSLDTIVSGLIDAEKLSTCEFAWITDKVNCLRTANTLSEPAKTTAIAACNDEKHVPADLTSCAADGNCQKDPDYKLAKCIVADVNAKTASDKTAYKKFPAERFGLTRAKQKENRNALKTKLDEALNGKDGFAQLITDTAGEADLTCQNCYLLRDWWILKAALQQIQRTDDTEGLIGIATPEFAFTKVGKKVQAKDGSGNPIANVFKQERDGSSPIIEADKIPQAALRSGQGDYFRTSVLPVLKAELCRAKDFKTGEVDGKVNLNKSAIRMQKRLNALFVDRKHSKSGERDVWKPYNTKGQIL